MVTLVPPRKPHASCFHRRCGGHVGLWRESQKGFLKTVKILCAPSPAGGKWSPWYRHRSVVAAAAVAATLACEESEGILDDREDFVRTLVALVVATK